MNLRLILGSPVLPPCLVPDSPTESNRETLGLTFRYQNKIKRQHSLETIQSCHQEFYTRTLGSPKGSGNIPRILHFVEQYCYN